MSSILIFSSLSSDVLCLCVGGKLKRLEEISPLEDGPLQPVIAITLLNFAGCMLLMYHNSTANGNFC